MYGHGVWTFCKCLSNLARFFRRLVRPLDVCYNTFRLRPKRSVLRRQTYRVPSCPIPTIPRPSNAMAQIVISSVTGAPTPWGSSATTSQLSTLSNNVARGAGGGYVVAGMGSSPTSSPSRRSSSPSPSPSSSSRAEGLAPLKALSSSCCSSSLALWLSARFSAAVGLGVLDWLPLPPRLKLFVSSKRPSSRGKFGGRRTVNREMLKIRMTFPNGTSRSGS